MAKKKTSKKNSSDRSTAEDAPSFEQALEELQVVVGKLEQGQLPLADSLAAYERGVTLLKICYGQLEQAEQQIRLLTGIDDQGHVQVAEFDGSATIDQLPTGTGTRRSASGPSGRARDESATDDPDGDPWEEDESDGRLF